MLVGREKKESKNLRMLTSFQKKNWAFFSAIKIEVELFLNKMLRYADAMKTEDVETLSSWNSQ
jgi:hypothetical protein